MNALNNRQYKFFLVLFLFFVLVSVPIWILAGDKENSAKPMQGILFAISVLILVLYGCRLLISHFKLKGYFIHWICLFWCVIMLVVLIFNGGMKSIGHLILWPVIFEMSYLSFLCTTERLKSIQKVYWVIFIWGTFLFLTSEGGYKNSVIHVLPNAIFTPLLSVPILMIKDDRRYRFFVLLLISFLVLISMKRSCIIIIAISWLAYGLPLLKLKNKLIAMVMVVLLVGAGFLIFTKMNNALGGQIENRINREETDTGKNRLAIWGVTWMMIEQSSIQGYIVGHGHMSVKKDSFLEISAHTDILEVIYDYGLIAFVLYLGLWVYVLKRWWYLKKVNSFLFFPYTISLAIFVVMSLVSHLILYTSYFNFLVMLWGCTEGMIINQKISDKYENLVCDKRLSVGK